MNKFFCDICGKEIKSLMHISYLEIGLGEDKKMYELCCCCKNEIYSYIENKRIEKQETHEV